MKVIIPLFQKTFRPIPMSVFLGNVAFVGTLGMQQLGTEPAKIIMDARFVPESEAEPKERLKGFLTREA